MFWPVTPVISMKHGYWHGTAGIVILCHVFLHCRCNVWMRLRISFLMSEKGLSSDREDFLMASTKLWEHPPNRLLFDVLQMCVAYNSPHVVGLPQEKVNSNNMWRTTSCPQHELEDCLLQNKTHGYHTSDLFDYSTHLKRNTCLWGTSSWECKDIPRSRSFLHFST